MSTNDPGSKPRGPVSRRSLWIAIAGFVVVIAVVVLIFALNGGTSGIGTRGDAVPPTTVFGTPTSTATTGPHQTSGGQTAPPSAPPVKFGSTAPVKPGVSVAVDDLTSVTGKANGPGEVGGPAIKFTVTFTNSTTAALSLADTVVSVYYGSVQNPGGELAHSGGTPLPASAAAGARVKGTYVFTVPADQRNDVRITVDYHVGTPVVVFQGAAPAA